MGKIARVTLLCGVLALASGCEPSPGDVLDTRTISAGAMEITLVLREEGTFGNPAHGQHFELLCRRGGEQVYVGRAYWVEGGLKRAPIERVVVDPPGFFFTDLIGLGAFSFDGCRNVSRWNGVLPPQYAARVRLNDQFDEVDTLVYCPGSTQIAFRVSKETFDGDRRLWVSSADGGVSWSAEPLGEAPRLCPAQKEVRIPAHVTAGARG